MVGLSLVLLGQLGVELVDKAGLGQEARDDLRVLAGRIRLITAAMLKLLLETIWMD